MQITFVNRAEKKKGTIRLRFRLRDGRDVQIFYKSDIIADVGYLSKFNPDGTKRGNKCNAELESKLKAEIAAMEKVYAKIKEQGLDPNSANFAKLMDEELHPQLYKKAKELTLPERFERYYEEQFANKFIGEGRVKHYRVAKRELDRFLAINGKTNATASDFDVDMLLRFRLFLFEEYKYVERFNELYTDMRSGNIPGQPRSANTVAEKMCIFSAFFSELEDMDEIPKSPFRRLGRERRRTILKEEYDEPIYLTKEEFLRVSSTEVPSKLQQTKDAFLLHCTIGCRIADFQKLTMENIAVKDGIAYIHYIPEKTLSKSKKEVETPLVLQSLEIAKSYGMQFPVLNSPWGSCGYNKYIKQLLELCGIDRPIKKYNQEKKMNEPHPLHELGSSKLCRKTYVDMMNKVQIDQYAAGLHKVGSDAISHYTNMTLRDRFILMCAAFNQPAYTADEALNITIQEKRKDAPAK